MSYRTVGAGEEWEGLKKLVGISPLSNKEELLSISIQPHCRLIIKGTLHYSKLVATYTLTFAGEYTKTEKQIKGKFIQTTPESYTGDITMEPITAD